MSRIQLPALYDPDHFTKITKICDDVISELNLSVATEQEVVRYVLTKMRGAMNPVMIKERWLVLRNDANKA